MPDAIIPPEIIAIADAIYAAGRRLQAEAAERDAGEYGGHVMPSTFRTMTEFRALYLPRMAREHELAQETPDQRGSRIAREIVQYALGDGPRPDFGPHEPAPIPRW